MTLDKNRVDEIFWLLSYTLPINDKKKFTEINKSLKYPIAHVLPEIIQALGGIAMQYSEDFDGYLEFLLQAIPYMRNETNVLPDVGYPPEEIRKMMAIGLGKLKEYQEQIKNEKA